MLKVLVKKQLLEINRAILIDRKTGKGKSRGAIVLALVGFAAIMLFLAAVFFFLGMSMITPFTDNGITWLYFTIMGGIAIFLGVFGSVFNTFSSLYQAKDNDFLLSLPIPSRYILATRLIGVYVMGALYSGAVFIPAMLVYYIFGSPSVAGVIGSVIIAVLISLFVLTLSCALGWVVAKINSKLKNKSFITVIVSVLFFAAYYFCVSQAQSIIESIVADPDSVANGLKLYDYPLYAFGKAGDGDLLSLLIISAVIIGLFALTYFVMSHSFVKIVTATTGVKRVAYKSDSVKARSYKTALFMRELKRFTSSATYMLNCGFSIIMLIIVSVAILLLPSDLFTAMAEAGLDVFAATGVFLVTSVLSAMTYITAPSVSLEGKSLWLIRSLPVDPKDALNAKIKLHFVLVAPCALLCSVCSSIALKTPVFSAVAAIAASVAFVFLSACFGLFLNLKMPDLGWTTEAAPIKQSFCSFLAMFGSMIFAIIMAGIAAACALVMPDFIGMIISLVIIAGVSVALYMYIIKRGTAIFSEL